MKASLTIHTHSDNSFDCLPSAMKEVVLLLAKATWAGDRVMDMGSEEFDAWNEADTFLRAHGLFATYR